MERASVIFLVISVTAFVAFVIGLSNPGRAIFWSREKTKAKSLVYLVIGVVFAVIWALVRF